MPRKRRPSRRSVSYDVSEARWKERRIRELLYSVGLRSRLLQQDVRTTEVCNPALRPAGHSTETKFRVYIR